MYLFKDHLAYLRYVLRHKWYVLMACEDVKVSLWRGLVHDWSKFLPSEWAPYVHTFYAPDGSSKYTESPAFAYAWNSHQKRQPHHWQYWMITYDRGETVCLEMPEKYVREMLADWIGAGMAITGNRDASPWYEKNKENIKLHWKTQQLVELLLAEIRNG